ncbi:MAG: hypothetical protein J5621_00800 [Paludibacteraceae bacterium]|nr:hypothetical protein [Paludibacteraceae bacterium]
MVNVPENIKIECLDMQRFLEETPANDPMVLSDRLTKTNIYLARSGQLLAMVKQIQDECTNEIFVAEKADIMNMSATLAKQYISSFLSEVNYYVNWLDRLNRAFVHSGDNIRTQMSFLKEELRITKSGY